MVNIRPVKHQHDAVFVPTVTEALNKTHCQRRQISGILRPVMPEQSERKHIYLSAGQRSRLKGTVRPEKAGANRSNRTCHEEHGEKSMLRSLLIEDSLF